MPRLFNQHTVRKRGPSPPRPAGAYYHQQQQQQQQQQPAGSAAAAADLRNISPSAAAAAAAAAAGGGVPTGLNNIGLGNVRNNNNAGLSSSNAMTGLAGGGGGSGLLQPQQQHLHPIAARNTTNQYQHQVPPQPHRQQGPQPQPQGPPAVVVCNTSNAVLGGNGGCYDNMEFTQLTQDSFSFGGGSSGGGGGGGGGTNSSTGRAGAGSRPGNTMRSGRQQQNQHHHHQQDVTQQQSQQQMHAMGQQLLEQQQEWKRDELEQLQQNEKEEEARQNMAAVGKGGGGHDDDDSSTTTDGRGDEEEEEEHSINLLAPSPPHRSNDVQGNSAGTAAAAAKAGGSNNTKSNAGGIAPPWSSGGGMSSGQWLSSRNRTKQQGKSAAAEAGAAPSNATGKDSSSSNVAVTPKGKGGKKAAAPNSASSRSTTSPATQTLNALSQMDAVGGGNLLYDPADDDDNNEDDDEGSKQSAVGAGDINGRASSDGGKDISSGKKKGGRGTKKSKGGDKSVNTRTMTTTPTPTPTPPRGKMNLTPKKAKKKKATTAARGSSRGTGWLTTTSAFAKADVPNGHGKKNGGGIGKKRSRQEVTTSSSTDAVKGSNDEAAAANVEPKRSKTISPASRNSQGAYTDRLITLSQPGKLGVKVDDVAEADLDTKNMLSSLSTLLQSIRPCLVTAIQPGSQAAEAGLGVGDVLFHPCEDEPKSAGRYATVEDVRSWAGPGAPRPVIFIARRFDNVRSVISNMDDGVVAMEPGSSKDAETEERDDGSKSLARSSTNGNEGGDDDEASSSESEELESFTFKGKAYDTYAEMVEAKRAHNREVLQGFGLVEAAATMREGGRKGKRAGNGSKKRKSASKDENDSKKRRKSSRLEQTEEEEEEEEGGLLPECGACTKPTLVDVPETKQHHFLCPERSDHLSSGAKDRLKQIRRTMKRCDCVACKWYLRDRGVESTKMPCWKTRTNMCSKGHDPLCERSKSYEKNKRNGQASQKSAPNAKTSSSSAKSIRLLRAVSFCRRCNEEDKDAAPPQHHVLCPSHPDFGDSGAQEKLERIQRNALTKGCEACSFHLENGHRDKSLAHGSACDFVSKERSKKSTESTRSATGDMLETSGEQEVDVVAAAAVMVSKQQAGGTIDEMRRQGAEGGCKKCKLELQTGRKALVRHGIDCPLGAQNKQGLRRMGAEGGCKKCQVELRTGKKERNSFHGKDCPLSMAKPKEEKANPRLEGAEGGCSKCKEELQTGKKDRYRCHDKGCYLARPRKASQVTDIHVDAAENIFESKPSSLRAKQDTSISTEKPTSVAVDTSSVPVGFQPDVNAKRIAGAARATFDQARVTPSPKPHTSTVEHDEESFEQVESDPEDDAQWWQSANPWGDVGQSEDDTVYLSPHGGLNAIEVAKTAVASPRFNENPFAGSSPYVNTHRPPSMGVRVFKLTRDIMAMRPWGLTFKRHEFGGACLVSAVDPMSPAAAAEDIGGAIASGSGARGLQLNDMILLANNKSVGVMNEEDLEVEMEICGPELVLVVSKFNGNPMQASALEGDDEDVVNTWGEVDKGAFDWQEMGPGSRSRSGNCVREDTTKQSKGHEASRNEVPNDSTGMSETYFDERSNELLTDHHEMVENGCDDMFENRQSSCVEEIIANEETGSTVQRNEESIEATTTLPSELLRSRKGDNDLVQGDEAGAADTQETEEAADDRSLLLGSQEDSARSSKTPRLSIDKIIADFSKPKKARTEATDDTHQEKPDEDGTTKKSATSTVEPITVLGNKADDKSTLAEQEQDSDGPSSIGKGKENPEGWDGEEDSEGDPVLGCVCGETHEEPIEVFWLQCDVCQAWYNNGVQCVGFDSEKAEEMTSWACWSCDGRPQPAKPERKVEEMPSDDEEEENEKIPRGSRVLVDCARSLYKGTVRKIRKSGGKKVYLINFDGNRKSTLTSCESFQIHSLIMNQEEDGPETEKKEEEEEAPRVEEKDRHTDIAVAVESPGAQASEEQNLVMTETEAVFLEGDNVQADSRSHLEKKKAAVDTSTQETAQPSPEQPSPEPQRKKRKNTSPKEKRKPICFETLEAVDPDLIEFNFGYKIEKRRVDHNHKPISVGTLVRVADRSGTSMAGASTKLGGVAKVIGRRGSIAERNLVYDVRYVVMSGREFDVAWKYVVPDEVFDDSQAGTSPGGARRSRSRRG